MRSSVGMGTWLPLCRGWGTTTTFPLEELQTHSLHFPWAAGKGGREEETTVILQLWPFSLPELQTRWDWRGKRMRLQRQEEQQRGCQGNPQHFAFHTRKMWWFNAEPQGWNLFLSLFFASPNPALPQPQGLWLCWMWWGYWCRLLWIGLGELKILNWTVNKGGEVVATQLAFISGYLLRQFHWSALVLNSEFISALGAELGCALGASALVVSGLKSSGILCCIRDWWCPATTSPHGCVLSCSSRCWNFKISRFLSWFEKTGVL